MEAVVDVLVDRTLKAAETDGVRADDDHRRRCASQTLRPANGGGVSTSGGFRCTCRRLPMYRQRRDDRKRRPLPAPAGRSPLSLNLSRPAMPRSPGRQLYFLRRRRFIPGPESPPRLVCDGGNHNELFLSHPDVARQQVHGKLLHRIPHGGEPSFGDVAPVRAGDEGVGGARSFATNRGRRCGWSCLRPSTVLDQMMAPSLVSITRA